MSAERRVDWAAWWILALFVAVQGAAIGSLQHNVDEGANVWGARVIQGGGAPFRDFFYQQPPLFLYGLSLLPTDHFWYGRLVSLLAAATAGRLLFSLGRPAFAAGSMTALLPLVVYASCGLQSLNLLAMPTSCMLLFALLAAWLLRIRSSGVGAVRAALAGASLAVSVLFKPLSLAVYPAVVAALVVGGRRREILPLSLAAVATGLGAWGAFHVASDGAFTELVRLHATRLGAGSQVEVLRQIPGMRDWLGGSSALGLSVRLHASTLTNPGNWLAFGMGLGGLPLLWRTPSLAPAEKVLWGAWLGASLLFSFVIWDVAYQHYHLLYLPPLALTAALALRALIERGPVVRSLAILAIVVGVALGVLVTQGARRDYGPALALRGHTGPVMGFDPTLNVLSGTEPGCGVTQFPLPPYDLVLSGREPDFDDAISQLIDCLEKSPETAIAIHELSPLALVEIDPALHAYILAQPEERVLYLSESARRAFLALH